MTWWNPLSWGKKGGSEPAPEPVPDNEKGRMLSQQMRQAEEAYDQMYGANPTAAYSEMKESSYEAIRLANELGLTRLSAELDKKLESRKKIFRDQLS
jgi:hypothetical protein